MTGRYLIGELSVRLERLQAAAGQAAACDVAELRRQVEASPVTWLAAETIRALALADQLCWDSLSRGDTGAFARQAQSARTCTCSASAPACSTRTSGRNPGGHDMTLRGCTEIPAGAGAQR